MNKGLYERAGASATESAAAWANRLEAPMTNWSKVYRGLRPPDAQSRPGSSSTTGGAVEGRSLRGAVAIGGGGGGTASSERESVSTVSSTRSCWPVTARRVSASMPVELERIRSAARVLGTARTSTSSSRAMARTPSNHRPHVFGASWERRAVAPCSQISAALTPRSNSTGASTGVEKVPLAGPLEAAAVRQKYSASGPG